MRVAEPTYNTSMFSEQDGREIDQGLGSFGRIGDVGMLNEEEKRVLDRIGEALARLGRVKRVGVGVREKIEFVRVWNSRARRR